jgi:hypothetical protein
MQSERRPPETAGSHGEIGEEFLHRLAEALEESSRILRNVAFLGSSGFCESALGRVEEEGYKAKIWADKLRNLVKDSSLRLEPRVSPGRMPVAARR